MAINTVARNVPSEPDQPAFEPPGNAINNQSQDAIVTLNANATIEPVLRK
jgi:hypothetical protein